jgi:hypothetical protein
VASVPHNEWPEPEPTQPQVLLVTTDIATEHMAFFYAGWRAGRAATSGQSGFGLGVVAGLLLGLVIALLT